MGESQTKAKTQDSEPIKRGLTTHELVPFFYRVFIPH